MADKRINALANTAPSTASDDFIAVDGTTNGTRKLNAFSPTFGGNATVTGTLTANGLLTAAATTSLDGLPTAAIFGATKRVAIGYNTSGDYGFVASADSGTTWKELHLNPVGGIVKVPNTSASTTTSTGALVVGNGTSGGLGVGGAGNFGGAVGVGGATVASRLHVYESTSGTGDSNGITIEQASTADAALQFLLTGVQRWTVGIDNSDSDKFKIGTGAIGSADRLTIDTTGNATVAGTLTMAGEYLQGSNVNFNITSTATSGNVYLKSNGGNLYLNNTAGNGDIRLGNTGTVAYVIGTTASTSTSSGALVVSGGVGVAGAMFLGGTLTAANGTSTAPSICFASAATSGFSRVNTNSIGIVNNGIASGYIDGVGAGGGLYIAASGTNQSIYLVPSGTGKVLIATGSGGLDVESGPIKTAAPAGGTAAAWKLGTVATVSPTSPNRTIEVDIGGTIYYIHAKTTNN